MASWCRKSSVYTCNGRYMLLIFLSLLDSTTQHVFLLLLLRPIKATYSHPLIKTSHHARAPFPRLDQIGSSHPHHPLMSSDRPFLELTKINNSTLLPRILSSKHKQVTVQDLLGSHTKHRLVLLRHSPHERPRQALVAAAMTRTALHVRLVMRLGAAEEVEYALHPFSSAEQHTPRWLTKVSMSPTSSPFVPWIRVPRSHTDSVTDGSAYSQPLHQ